MSWILETLLYGVLKGVRDVVKKESLKISSSVEVLFFYTLFAFLFCIPASKDILSVDVSYLPYVFIKSFVIFIAWILSFRAIKDLPLSVYGILDLSRVLFATSLGIFVLGEPATRNQIIGLILVAVGLVLLKRRKGEASENIKPLIVVMALASCVFNAVSGFLDKVLTRYITPSQLQFYYMFFLTLLYLIYLIVDALNIPETIRIKVIKIEEAALHHSIPEENKWESNINIKRAVKNYWIWILAILFVIADKSLFIANANPESKITIMTLVKQSGCIVSILAGKFIYKEKNMLHKFICAVIIILGIVIAVIK